MLRYAITALLAALTFTASAQADAGSPDPGFGTNGVQLLDTTGNQSESGVAVQADGKLIVINRGTNDQFALIHRLRDDGSIDPGFGTVTVDGTGSDFLNAVLVQPDGKLLVGGRSNLSAVIYRFTAAGAPDPGFGVQGKVTLPPLTQFTESVFDLALRDGKIVAVGQSFTKAAVWKRNLLDGSADGASLITIPQGGDNDLAAGVAIQPDGKIVVAGSTSAGANGFVARLTTGLGLDPAFQGGVVPISNGQLETAASVALQQDGKIVVAGRTSANINSTGDIMVSRFTTLGLADPDFNGSGKRFVDSGTNEFASKVLVQPDGKLVIAGSDGDVLFYRLTSAGANDDTFDFDGARGIDAGGADTSADAALQPDGKIVSVGSGLGVGIAVRVFGDPIPLTVTKTGTGKGAVVSEPLGLNCGATCTAGFDAGTRVTLTAVPSPGSAFAGWTGCKPAGATCTVDLRAATAVTASFAAVAQQPGGAGGGGTAGGGAATGGATPPPGAAPAITGARLSATRFRVASRRTAISAAVRRGTSVRYTLSTDAATTVTISRAGRTVMTLTRAKTTRGANLIAFSGWTAKKTLRPGRYRMTLVATDAAGARSKPVTLGFSVLSGR